MALADARFYILSLLLIGFTLIFLYFLLRIVPRMIKARHWPSVIGQVLVSDITEWERTNKKNHYALELKYTYSVHGTPYESERYMLGGSVHQQAVIQNIVDTYPVGSDVAVYYDPEAPDVAILKKDMGNGYIWFVSILLLFFIATPAFQLYTHYLAGNFITL